MNLLRTTAEVPARAAIVVLRAYQLVLSPMLGPVCRYAPSCSSYAVEAIRSRGLAVGATLAARRLLRCNPWALGGWDPVPSGPLRPSRHQHEDGAGEHVHHHDDQPGRHRADHPRTPGRTP